MNYILFDGEFRTALLPLTYLRPVADIRIGILTIREKWEKYLGLSTSTITENYLQEKFPMVEMQKNILINASYLPCAKLVETIKNLSENQAIFKGENIIAFFKKNSQKKVNFNNYKRIEYKEKIIQIKNTFDIFLLNGQALKDDFDLLIKGKTSQPIPSDVQCINKKNIFIEKGATISLATLNATNGPIYIGKNAEIMETSAIRGPFAMGEKSILKMGTKVYGATTLGPHCKVGGEIKNSIFFGYSNKGHEGYLGDSVIGEWCNLGAGTNNSNLKNNYSKVRLWNYNTNSFANTGLQFCGLIMGDHSKCGIATMFNTGTIVGVNTIIFGSNFQKKFIPSFSWGGTSGFVTYQLEKALELIRIVMKRRTLVFDQKEQKILEFIFKETSKYRQSFALKR